MLSAFFPFLEVIRILLLRLKVYRSNINPIVHITPLINHFNKSRIPDGFLSMKESNGQIESQKSTHRILVVGQLRYGTTSWSRLKALEKLIESVQTIDIIPSISKRNMWSNVFTNHLYLGPNINHINRQVIKRSEEFQPDILWVDKGLHIWPETLDSIRERGCRLLIHYSPDNHMIPGNQSRHYLESIPKYDVHVTTKMSNINWLIKCGAPVVKYTDQGYDPSIHRPVQLSKEESTKFACDIGFVGHWEPSREEILLWLWRQGYKMKVWGENWNRAKNSTHPLFINARYLVGDDYAKAISGAKINLCLLSNWFGDKTTSRSMEIPACGKFMLAERNNEHLALFEEGIEAEFYETRRELLNKINYYLKHENERNAIGKAGLRRCNPGYSNEARLKRLMLEIL